MSKTITCFHVFAISNSAAKGWLVIGNRRFACLLGKNGRAFRKREGDGKSPIGTWRLTGLYFRPDKMLRPRCRLPTAPLRRDDGWCDAKGHKDYNRKVKLPCAASHEDLWRSDEAYDLLATTSHNQRPRKQGAGSAIFLHVWRKGATGTEGCIALKPGDLRKVLAAMGRKAVLKIQPAASLSGPTPLKAARKRPERGMTK